MGSLYRLSFPNGKAYIGITKKTAAQRFADHVRGCSRLGRPVNAALREFGAASARLEVLASAAEWPQLCELERAAIAEYGTKWPLGYNVTDGGQFPSGLTAESRAKLSQAAIANPRRKGTATSDVGRANMSKARTGMKLSATARANIAAASARRRYPGRVMSEDQKAKNQAAHRKSGRPLRPNNASGYTGVAFDPVNKKWRAHITIDRKMLSLGRHAELHQAIEARAKAEVLYFAEAK